MELSYVTQTIIDSLSLIDFSPSPTGSPSTILRIYTYTSVFLLPGKLLFTN